MGLSVGRCGPTCSGGVVGCVACVRCLGWFGAVGVFNQGIFGQWQGLVGDVPFGVSPFEKITQSIGGMPT